MVCYKILNLFKESIENIVFGTDYRRLVSVSSGEVL